MKTTPFWWEEAEPEHGETTLDESRCDALIVGAGYTGLSAAITLAEAGAGKVIVIDSMRIGEGASSRNGGQTGNTAKFSLETAQRKFGDKLAREIMDDYGQAQAFLIDRGKTLADDFDFQMCGSITAIYGTRALKRLRAGHEAMSAEDRRKVRFLDKSELPSVLKSDLYKGALVRDGYGSLHPAKYVRALARRAVALGVRIFTPYQYVSARKAAGGFVADIRSASGERREIEATRILLAVNGYGGKRMKWLRDRVIPVQSYMIATEPLPFGDLETLMPENRMCFDSKHVLYYFRRSPDGTRILFGGRAKFSDIDAETSAHLLRDYMISVFPSLADVEITHSWLGNVCFAMDFMSHAGTTPDGLHYSTCCNGNGISMSTYMGHRIAEAMLEKPGAVRGVVNVDPPRIPFYGGTPWFLPIVGRWYHARDKYLS